MANNKTTTKPAAKPAAKTATKPVKEEAKATVEVEVESVEAVVEQAKPEVAQAATKTPRKFAQDELILCRSITSGELLYPSRKTGQLYIWSNYGDYCEVEYQDLQSLKSTRSPYIFKPHFIIEDEELLEQWNKDLAPLYEKLSDSGNIESFFAISDFNTFKEKLTAYPEGIKNSIKIMAAEKVKDGSLDSRRKIDIIDEVLKTDLKTYME